MPGTRAVAQVAVRSKKLVSIGVILRLISILRAKQIFPEFQANRIIGNFFSYVFTVIVGNSLGFATSVEDGIINGVTTVFRDEHPWRGRWVARAVLYGGVVVHLDLHWRLARYLPRRLSKLIASCRAPSRRGSEPGSEPDYTVCQASVLYMDLPSKLTVLSQKSCADPVVEMAKLLAEPHIASRIQSSELTNGIPLCRTHRDIYQTLRPNQACAALQRNRLGISGPEGKRYCGVHMGGAVAPAPDGPKVKFPNENTHPMAPSQGLRNIPDEVLRSTVQKRSIEVDGAASGISHHLDEEYGGIFPRTLCGYIVCSAMRCHPPILRLRR